MIRQLLEQMAEFQHKALSTIDSITQRFTESHSETTRVLQTWLEGFRVTQIPTSTVVRDEDQIAKDKERYRNLGFEIPDDPLAAEAHITEMLKGL